MTDLPAPMTPADCDLQDFPFMPLHVARLRDSDLASTAHPEACWYAVLLWCASWHQLPAGSLPDDDAILTRLIGLGRDVRSFRKHKAEAMRGFVLCDDGRLYHPTVAEQALSAWESKLQQRWRTECARIKKANQRNGTNLPSPTYEQFLAGVSPEPDNPSPQSVPWDTAECPSGQTLQETGTGTGTSKKEANASSVGSALPKPTAGLFEVEETEQPARPKPNPWDRDPDFAALWAGATDEGRARAKSKANVWPHWKAAKARAGEGVTVVEALARYRAKDPDVGRTGGPGLHIWLRDGTWALWTTDGGEAASAPARVWTGPPDIRATLVRAALEGENFALGYVDPCGWREVPTKALLAPNEYTAKKLRSEVGHALDQMGIGIVVKVREGVAA